jgi:hypothetical protein
MAKDELEWQQRNTKREIDVLSDDIRGLKQAISDKDKPLEVRQYTLLTTNYTLMIGNSPISTQ